MPCDMYKISYCGFLARNGGELRRVRLNVAINVAGWIKVA